MKAGHQLHCWGSEYFSGFVEVRLRDRGGNILSSVAERGKSTVRGRGACELQRPEQSRESSRHADARLTAADARGGKRHRIAHRTVRASFWRAASVRVWVGDLGQYPVPLEGVVGLNEQEKDKRILDTAAMIEYDSLKYKRDVVLTPWRWVFTAGLLLAWATTFGSLAIGRSGAERPTDRQSSNRTEPAFKACPHCGGPLPAYAEACQHCKRVHIGGSAPDAEPLS